VNRRNQIVTKKTWNSSFKNLRRDQSFLGRSKLLYRKGVLWYWSEQLTWNRNVSEEEKGHHRKIRERLRSVCPSQAPDESSGELRRRTPGLKPYTRQLRSTRTILMEIDSENDRRVWERVQHELMEAFNPQPCRPTRRLPY